MTTPRLVLILIFPFLWINSYGQRIDKIKILEGQGIIFNNDSILLDKTLIHQTSKILRVKDPKIIEVTNWDNFDEGKSGTTFRQVLNNKNLHFEYWSDKSEKDLKLITLKIVGLKNVILYDKNGIEIKKNNPLISNLYPTLKDQDYVAPNGLSYILDSYGLTFILDFEKGNNKVLKEISIYKKK
jgi:hypothetical protein